MDKDERLSYLQEELDMLKQRADRNQKSNRNKAFIYKMLAITCAASITVLLGLNVQGTLADVFRDIALGLGAAITVLNAAEAFFDYRSLWIKDTLLSAKLEELKRDMKIYAHYPKQGTDHEKSIDEFRVRLNRILKDHIQNFELQQSQQGKGSKGSERP